MFLLIFILAMIFLYYKTFQTGGPEDNIFKSFGFFVAIFGIIESIDVFSRLRSTGSGIFYLMLPATTFEKFLAALLYTTLFTFIVYLSTFYIIQFLVVNIGNMFVTTDVSLYFPDMKRILDNLTDMLFFQSLYFLGSIIFKKNPIGKTTAAIVGIIILISIVSGLVMKQYFSEYGIAVNNGSYNFNFDGDFNDNLMLPDVFDNLKLILEISFYVIPLLCWTGAFFKLKKTEI
jgi:hypothetical protein